MRILIHTPDFPPCDGGISTVAYEYARTFHDHGHEVLVITPSPCYDMGEWDSKQRFALNRISNIKAFALKYYYQLFQLRKVLSKKRFDLLISQRWNVSGLICEKARNSFSIPHYQWFHGNEIYDRHLSQKRWERLFRTAITNADLNIMVSSFTERKLRDRVHLPLRSQVIYSGVDVNKFVPAGNQEMIKSQLGFSGRYVLLTLGRLVARKGQDQVIQALPKIVPNIPNILYVIAGKGKYEEHLKSLVRSLALEKHVYFTGFITEEQKLSYYQMCDQYLMPSREIEDEGDIEGFGLTFLEANACGKPVIAGASGGCTEAVKENVNGLIINPLDTDAISASVLKLYDPDFYSKLSTSAISYVNEHLSWDRSAQTVIECLTQNKDKE